MSENSLFGTWTFPEPTLSLTIYVGKGNRIFSLRQKVRFLEINIYVTTFTTLRLFNNFFSIYLVKYSIAQVSDLYMHVGTFIINNGEI